MNILFFQYGDYSEAYQRFRADGGATYRDQKESVDLVSAISRDNQVTVVSIRPEPHDKQLTDSLRSIGVLYDELSGPRLSNILDEISPDRLICRTPDWRILKAAKRRKIPTLPYFADMFRQGGLRKRFRYLRLRHMLSGPHIPCICNHSRNASLSLHQALGIPKARIVPWDRRVIETGFGPKPAPDPGGAFRLFYAGSLNEAKGIGDVLFALHHMMKAGFEARLSIASRSDITAWQSQATKLGLAERVHFLGTVPNDEILDVMRENDAILVPTRHSYPEGLPNTLREALAVQVPLIASDHPAFASRLEHERDCLFFPAGNPDALAETILHLAKTPALYQRLTRHSAAALEQLPYGLYWDDLWKHFLDKPSAEADWVKDNSLAALEAQSKARHG